MTTSVRFEDLPPAARNESVLCDDMFVYSAEYEVERADGERVRALIHASLRKDRARELRLRRYERDGRAVGQLVDRDGVVLAVMSTDLGRPVTSADDEAFVTELATSLVVLVARWRERATIHAGGQPITNSGQRHAYHVAAEELEAVLRSAT